MKADGHTSIGGSGGRFPTTHWTVLTEVQAGDDARRRFLVAELIRDYWKPVYCYLRRKGYGNEDAKDLTQGYFQEVVVGRNLIPRADARRGRFRTLMLTALDRYLANIHRLHTAQKRIPRDKLLPLDRADIGELPQVSPDLTCEESFTYAWISDLLDRVLEEVEADCRSRGMAVHWDLFQERVVRPILDSKDPPALAELCTRHGIDAPTKASNMIFAVKRRLQAALKRALHQSVANEADMQEEIVELAHFLGEKPQDAP